MTTKKCDGDLSLVKTEVIDYSPVTLTPEGNVILPESMLRNEEVLDVLETSVWCEKHGRLSTEQFEAHGLSEEWQEV